MKRTLVVLISCGLAGCGTGKRLLPDVEQFTYQFLALSPTLATANGYHVDRGRRLDDQLDDFSPRGIEAQRQFYRDWKTRLEGGYDPSKLGAEDRADLRMLRDQVEFGLLELDTIQSWRHNPTVYVELIGNALFSPYTLEYAPKAERYRHIVGRLEKIPAFVETAKGNLVDAPEIWNAVAQEEGEGNLRLIDGTLREAAPAEIREEYDRAARPALEALRGFNEFLKGELAHRQAVDWRLGCEKYERKFRAVLETDSSPEQVLADAEQQLAAMRQQMLELARKMPATPQTGDLNTVVAAALDKVAQHHASRAGYGEDARSDLAEATRFVGEHQLLGLPRDANLQVIDTPEFMHGIYSVGGFNPAPPLEPKLQASYWLTPIPASWPEARVESKLREYNFYGLKILTIHEAMPGHYVQAEYAAGIQPPARRAFRAVFGNGPYVEGWAVYVTEMMIDQGYHNDAEMRLTFLKQMLRVVSNTILDVRMQTMDMTDEQAMTLMMRDTFQEKEEAEGKLQRAKLSSCQLPTYFVGWRDWKRVLDQERHRRGTEFSLRAFHERALDEGAVPLPWLGRLLGGGESAKQASEGIPLMR